MPGPTSTPSRALTVLLLLASAAAAQQNGSNFTVLSNGIDVSYLGVGGGGPTWPPNDGMGNWIPGEDLKGARQTSLGDWGYRLAGWRESVCKPKFHPSGDNVILFPNIAFVELDGRNGHQPDVFTTPACASGGLVGLVSGAAPYGVPHTPGVPTPSASFVVGEYPSTLPELASLTLLLPNNGLHPSAHGGSARFVGNTGLTGLGINSTGFCWVIQFTWSPSAVPLHDDIDGLWHWAHSNSFGTQYWGLSNNELGAWQSHSVARVSNALVAFTANLEYDFALLTVDPQTHEALQPAASGNPGFYYATTVDAGGGNPGVPGAGFDLGRHDAWSQSGTLGVVNPNTGLANQDPAAAAIPGLLPSLGFATWDNALDPGETVPAGGWRLTWLTVDWDASLGIDPALAGDVTVWAGQVRLPTTIPSVGPWPQPLTQALLPWYVHEVVNHDGSAGAPSWPDPHGFPSGTFGIPGVNGASLHLPLVLGPVCLGVPVALTFGSTGLAGPSGPLDWNPATGRASSSRQLFLLD